MKTDGRTRDQLDAFETRLRVGLDTIASTTRVHTPAAFDPDDVMPLGVDEAGRRRFKPALAAAAVAAVTVTGLLVIGSWGEEPARSDQPLSSEPEAGAAGPETGPVFRFETPTVRLEAATVEVITPSGTFVPTADVTVEGDPGMPDQYTSLELTWHDGVEQRINIYFASDGATWWADEIRTYDGTEREEWFEPPTTGQFFESPLGMPYTGDIDLPNLRITGLTLQAFVAPAACETPTAPIALIADYPAIRSWTPGGFGASFQIYDTATCTPRPIDNYTFEFTTDDPAVAVIIDLGQVEEADTDTTTVTTPDAPPTQTRPERRDFDDIKSRVQLNFPGPGSTTLHATARDTAGTVIGTVDIPITVTTSDDADMTADTTPRSVSPSTEILLPTTVLAWPQAFVAPGAVVCIDAGATQRAVTLCVDELGGGPIKATGASADSFVAAIDPTNPTHATDAATIGEALDLPVRSMDPSLLPAGIPVPDAPATTYLVLSASDIPYAT